MGVRLDQRHQAGPFGHIDADHQRVRHLVGGHALQDGGQVGGQFGEIQMAVGIDVHGNPGCGRRLTLTLAGAALVRAAGEGGAGLRQAG